MTDTPPTAAPDTKSLPGMPPARSRIEDCVHQTLRTYLEDLGDTPPRGMHEMVMRVAERALLELVLDRTRGNQSRAAEWLGINRNTLRRKLAEHRLLP
jgi:Fis family transcriptional regulator